MVLIFAVGDERGFDREKERVLGFGEIEEKEREDNEDVRADIETAIFL